MCPKVCQSQRAPDFSEHFFAATLPIIKASGGAVFVLFTSFRHMESFQESLIEATEEDEFVILMQGQTTKRELLESFTSHRNAVFAGHNEFLRRC